MNPVSPCVAGMPEVYGCGAHVYSKGNGTFRGQLNLRIAYDDVVIAVRADKTAEGMWCQGSQGQGLFYADSCMR